jgi:hypothetical protein
MYPINVSVRYKTRREDTNACPADYAFISSVLTISTNTTFYKHSLLQFGTVA